MSNRLAHPAPRYPATPRAPFDRLPPVAPGPGFRLPKPEREPLWRLALEIACLGLFVAGVLAACPLIDALAHG